MPRGSLLSSVRATAQPTSNHGSIVAGIASRGLGRLRFVEARELALDEGREPRPQQLHRLADAFLVGDRHRLSLRLLQEFRLLGPWPSALARETRDFREALDERVVRKRLGRTLLQIAQLIKANVGLEIAFADCTGWDTHVNQGSSEGQLSVRLRELGLALSAFTGDLGERMRNVVVLTMSEFGRTIRENGNSGTDHGHATAMLVAGGPVNGGRVLGRWPGLEMEQRFEGRDVPVTTDFRDLFGEILTRHLGATDLTPVFPGYAPAVARFPGAIRG